MEVTVTKKFGDAFDPMNESHVTWIKQLHDSTQSEKNIEKVMTENPFKIKVAKKDVLEWIEIQFMLSMKYTIAVLNCKAWVPSQQIK